MLNRLKLNTRLLVAFFLIGPVPVMLIGFFSALYAQKALYRQIEKDLVSICDAKSLSVKTFLSSHLSNVKTLSTTGTILDAVETLEESFDEMGGTITGNMLWQALSDRYYPGLAYYIKEQGYRDLYLISPDGDIVFSVARKQDLGKNLLQEELRFTSLAHCFKKALTREFLSDFALYPPHGNEPAAFVGAPVMRGDTVSGVVALYVSIDMINQMMLRRSGLGSAGETYLVGEDFLLRSDTYHSEDFTVQSAFENPEKWKMDNQAVLKGFMGFSGCVLDVNYAGEPVIRAFSPVVISEMTWVVIADLNKSKAFEPIRVFKLIIMAVVLAGVVVVVLFCFFLSAKISGPIKRLTSAAEQVREGRFDIRIDPELTAATDEVGILAGSFDRMAVELDRMMQNLVSEIREKEKAHDTLREKEEQLSSIVDNTTSIVYLKDLDHRLIMVNPRYLDLVGKTRSEVIGKTDYDLYPEKTAATYIQNDKIVVEKDAPCEFEEIVDLPGRTRFYLTVKFPIHDRHGRACAVCGVSTDITELKENEQILRDALAFNEKIISRSPVGMAIFDGSGQCIEINEAMCTMIGTGRRDALTHNYHRIRAWKDSGLYDTARQAISENTTMMNEVNLNTSYGKNVWLKAFLMPFDSAGRTNLLLMAIDITTEVTVQKEKKIMEDQLRQAHKMEAIGTLAGGIAHDFNNILSAILGYSQMAHNDLSASDPARSKISKVIQAGMRARDLVRQILSFSRKTEQDRVPVSIRGVIEEAVKLLRASIPSTIDIRSTVDPGCGYILADATQVHQVVMNLCVNAAQAMEDGGVLTLETGPAELTGRDFEKTMDHRPGSYIEISIRDTGVGMRKEVLDRIFDPYFTTREIGKGSGMGLAVVHGIVTAHDGFLRVHSEPGKGSDFRVFFPKIDSETPGPDIVAPVIRKGNEHILVVDDEDTLVEISKLRLENLGYRVTGTTSGRTAYELVKNSADHFDLVLTDQTMPEMTGRQLARKLFELKPDLPVILCSGFSHPIEDTHAPEVAAFIMKPVEMDELAVTIRQILDNRIQKSDA